MGWLRINPVNITNGRINKIVSLLIVSFLLFISKSQCLNITYTAEAVKTNSHSSNHLGVSLEYAEDMLTAETGSSNSGRNTSRLNAANPSKTITISFNELHGEPTYSDELDMKNRIKNWNWIFRGVILGTCAFAILIMTVSRLIDKRIEYTKDTFLKNAYNMCFNQIALIGLINLVLWLILQTNLAKKIDSRIFMENDIDPTEKGLKPIVEPIFECLLCVSVILLAWYIVYVIYFQFVARRIISWMRKTDNSDVLTMSKDLEGLDNDHLARLWNFRTIHKGRFLVSRFEFIENINNMRTPKIDPGGYYFLEYLRANLLDVSVKMLRFPPEVVVCVMILSTLLRNTFRFEGKKEVVVIAILCSVCAAVILFFGLYVFHIESKLYPDHLSEYLFFKYNTINTEGFVHLENNIIPKYKLAPLEDEPLNFLISRIHGDGPVNKHENLFIFKSKGPKILVKTFRVICFSFLFILSIWVYLIQQHQRTWLKRFDAWNGIVLGTLVLMTILIPKILYSLIVVSKTGLLIDMDTLEKVWEAHRSNNTRHAIELIDALNFDAVATSLDRNGDTYWRHLVAKLKASPLAIQKQMADIWSGLDSKKRGTIGTTKILRFIQSQGLQITNKKKIKEFIKCFTRTQPNKLNEEEFLVLGLVIKQMIVMPVDTSQMKVLFEEVYGIPWTSSSGIDPDTLQTIIKRLGLKWTEGDRRHLLDFLRGCKCEAMSAENFIEQLSTVEQLLKPTEYNSLVMEA